MGLNNILIVDDEAGIRELLSEILEDEGYRVHQAENAGRARQFRAQSRPDLVLLDIWMPDTDGITLLKEWSSGGLLTMPVVMMSGHGTIETAVEATRIGAVDFLEKPIGLQKLLATVSKALQRAAPEAARILTLATLGRSPVMASLRQRLEQVAGTAVPVLLTGEPGAGVELCARYLHRPNTPWVSVDAPAVLADAPMSLLEQAREGLLFLEEVSTLTRLEQKGLAILLGQLQRYSARLVGGTVRDLPTLVAEGVFDPRLYEMLAGVTIRVPGLREHRDDVPELASAALAQYIESGRLPARQFSTAALNLLRQHDWPGNFAELLALVRSVATIALGEEIGPEDVAAAMSQPAGASAALATPLDLPLREARDLFEKAYLEHHLQVEGGNMTRVSEKTGLERTHLYRKIKQLGIKPGRRGQ